MHNPSISQGETHYESADELTEEHLPKRGREEQNRKRKKKKKKSRVQRCAQTTNPQIPTYPVLSR